MSNGIVVFNEVNPYTGMRGLLVKRAGQAVDLAEWLELVPARVRGSLVFEQFELEQGSFVWHHLKMDWMTRELIGFEADDSRLAALGVKPTAKCEPEMAIPAAAWMLEPGERLSMAIGSAVDLFWEAVGLYPKVALVRSLPEGAPNEMEIPPPPALRATSPIRSATDGGGRLKIIQAEWVWRRMVVVL